METATSIELFVEILDRYVYYFDQGNESVSSDSATSFGQHNKTAWRTGLWARLTVVIS